MPEYMCVGCGHTFVRYTTTQRYCGKCQFNRYAKPRKPIKRMGKVAKEWVEFRHGWIKDNPGPWVCYLQISPDCIRNLDIDTLTLEHVVPKSRAPQLRTDSKNIKPACYFCNSLKGSRSLDKVKGDS